jgi:hypothetical protein
LNNYHLVSNKINIEYKMDQSVKTPSTMETSTNTTTDNNVETNFEFIKQQLKTIDSNFEDITNDSVKYQRRVDKLVRHHNRVVNNLKKLNIAQKDTVRQFNRITELLLLTIAFMVVLVLVNSFLN